MTTKICVVMASIQGREEMRAATLAQLALDVQVFVRPDIPLGTANCHAVQCDALEHALVTGRPFVLFVEDDLLISSLFPAALAVSVAAALPVITFYCAGKQFYPAALQRAVVANERIEPGLYRVCNRRRFFGSQALLMRRDFVEAILWDWDAGPLDLRVAELSPDTFSAYVPNPVQHLAPPSAWSRRGKPHHSRSFVP